MKIKNIFASIVIATVGMTVYAGATLNTLVSVNASGARSLLIDRDASSPNAQIRYGLEVK